MTQRKHTPTYTAEFRERGIRLFKENRTNYPSNNAAYKAIASKLSCSGDSLRAWCQQVERDAGERNGLAAVSEGLV
jgi:transposase